MYIHEAIEKAGPGGKIRREGWDGEWLYRKGDPYLCNEYGEAVSSQTIENLTASDWEVVQDKIEVGDVVSKDPCKGSERHGCTVLTSACSVTSLSYLPDACACRAMPTNKLTLIRKGPKCIVLEGVKPERYVSDGLVFSGARLDPCDGKTFRATFEEME